MYLALGTSSQGWGVVSKRPDGDASRVDRDWIVKVFHTEPRKAFWWFEVTRKKQRERSTVGLGSQAGKFALYYKGKRRHAAESQAS